MRRSPATVLVAIFVVCFCLIHQDVTAVEDLAEYLWQETKADRLAALEAPFIQRLKTVSLDPKDFGAYNIQDAIYMYRTKQSIDIAVSRATDETIKKFLQARSNSYRKNYLLAFKTWHIGDPEGIVLGSACENYCNHLKNVSLTMKPVYLVAALIPCAKLWPWLGGQIHTDSPEKFGVYKKWVQGNLDPNDDGYKKYETVINEAYQRGGMTKENALAAYRGSMKGEAAFFSSM